jgi:hypothetical protein
LVILWVFFPERIFMRGKNLVDSVEIAFTVNTQTAWYLDRLVEMGTYGNTRQEAARIALFKHCDFLIASGDMAKAPRLPTPATAINPS